MYAESRILLLLIYELKRGHITENVSSGNYHRVFVSGSFTFISQKFEISLLFGLLLFKEITEATFSYSWNVLHLMLIFTAFSKCEARKSQAIFSSLRGIVSVLTTFFVFVFWSTFLISLRLIGLKENFSDSRLFIWFLICIRLG